MDHVYILIRALIRALLGGCGQGRWSGLCSIMDHAYVLIRALIRALLHHGPCLYSDQGSDQGSARGLWSGAWSGRCSIMDHVYVLIGVLLGFFLFHTLLVPSLLSLIKKNVSCLGLKQNRDNISFRNEPENDKQEKKIKGRNKIPRSMVFRQRPIGFVTVNAPSSTG